MSQLNITVTYSAGSIVVSGTQQVIQLSTQGALQVIQLGSLSAAAQAQIGSIQSSYNAIANGTATDAGTLTGAEKVTISRSSGLLSTTFQKLATWVLTLICPQVATFAALPASPTGFYLVLADETKSGSPTIYFFTATHRYWIAMVQDA